MDPTRPLASSTRIPSATREQIAIERAWLTPAQVEECLVLHQALLDMGLTSTLGEVLVRKGYLDERQLAELDVALGARPAISIPGYEIIEKIAEGGMGAVYRAHQTSMDRAVAIKLLLPRFAADDSSRERLIREARAVAKLSHPNVVAGIDAGESGGVCYFIMEFIDGLPMDQVLRERGPLPWREATAIARQVAAALEHAELHGIVHRDVKPGNILLLKDGQAKLADLGLARVSGSEESHLTQSGMIVGSPAYLSPEQAAADPVLDIRSDLFSLGLTLFELITGERAYVGSNPMSVLTALLTRDVAIDKLAAFAAPRDLVAVVRHMVERDPASRYQSATDLLADFDALLAGRAPTRLRSPSAAGLATTTPLAAGITSAVTAPLRLERRSARRFAYLLVAVTTLLLLAWQVYLRLTPAPTPAMAQPATSPEIVRPLAPDALPISLLEATDIALAHLGNGAAAYHAELEGDEYSVDVAVAQRSFNVQVNGRDGKIEATLEEHEDHSAEVTMAKITLGDAVGAANQAHSGEPVEAEILLLPGQTVIEVKLMREGGPIWVEVDATTATVSPLRDKPQPSA